MGKGTALNVTQKSFDILLFEVLIIDDLFKISFLFLFVLFEQIC